jgi:hypothetical protein
MGGQGTHGHAGPAVLLRANEGMEARAPSARAAAMVSSTLWIRVYFCALCSLLPPWMILFVTKRKKKTFRAPLIQRRFLKDFCMILVHKEILCPLF